MKTEPTFISNESLKKQLVNQPASHYRVISLIKLTFYIAVLIGFWLADLAASLPKKWL